MRLLGAGAALAGLAAVAFAAIALRDRVLPPDAALPAAAAASQAEPEAAPSVLTAEPVPARVRPVAPDVVAIPAVEQDALERITAREPLSPPVTKEETERPPRLTVLHRPHALAAGMFHSLGYTVLLAGVEPPDMEETCVADGVSWPCGVHARTAFRSWLRGRALSCVVPAKPVRGDVVVSDCSLGRQNPAEWLVVHGWARAVAGGPYAPLEAAARQERRGIFGPAPAVPEPLTITLPELSGDASGG